MTRVQSRQRIVGIAVGIQVGRALLMGNATQTIGRIIGENRIGNGIGGGDTFKTLDASALTSALNDCVTRLGVIHVASLANLGHFGQSMQFVVGVVVLKVGVGTIRG